MQLAQRRGAPHHCLAHGHLPEVEPEVDVGSGTSVLQDTLGDDLRQSTPASVRQWLGPTLPGDARVFLPIAFRARLHRLSKLCSVTNTCDESAHDRHTAFFVILSES